MEVTLRVASLSLLAMLALAGPAAGQARVGELSSSLNGTIAPSYSATYGSNIASTHSWDLGGSANYSGYYHSPNFVSLTGSMYLNQSRANSNYQSISNASGFNVSSGIFGGSRFPGTVSYSKAYNSEGNYAIPGLANYVTHGNSDTLGITWSESVPDAPSVSAGFQMGSSQYTVYGANDQGNNAFHSFNVHSSYSIAGFNLGGFAVKGSSNSTVPQVIAAQTETRTNTDTSGFGFNLMHPLPLQGAITASLNRSSWNGAYLGYKSTGTVDLYSAQATLHPFTVFGLSGSVNYSDNLSGQLYQQTGAITSNPNQTSNSLDLDAVASYNPDSHLQTSVFVERRTQEFLGQQYGVNSYGASASYAHPIRTGSVSASLTLADNTSDKSGSNSLGLSANGTYAGDLRGWSLTGSVSYVQDVQTLLVTYMNSAYHFNGTARRSFGRVFVSGSGGMARTALSQNKDTASSTESFNGTVGYGRYLSGTASYSRASGEALATGAGLVPVQPPLPGANLVFFGGNSYSFGVSSNPTKKLVMSAAYAKSTSNTSSSAINSLPASQNGNEQFNALLQYQVRKMTVNSGYARLVQSFSGSGGGPQSVSSYSAGVSRWFNFF